MERYLTKSRFSLAMECPTKLYYTDKKNFANQKLENDFLAALAEGGFQVGELARQYYPGGISIDTLDKQVAVQKTLALLKQENVVIYEAAMLVQGFFIRADILVKNGSLLRLIEVKAKSYHPNEPFVSKNGKSLLAAYRKYFLDIAFQTFVTRLAFPQFQVIPYLMMADQSKLSPTNGLNQKFLIVNEDGRKKIKVVAHLTEEELSKQILTAIDVDTYCQTIFEEKFPQEMSFEQYAFALAKHYQDDIKISPIPGKHCAACEFKASDEEKKKGLQSGFETCWKETFFWDDKDFLRDSVLSLWNYRKKDDLIAEEKLFLSDVTDKDILVKGDGKPGLSSPQRQWLQVEKSQNGDASLYLDKVNLKQAMSTWIYPLHFIDFETTAVAIPFNKGRHPYEGVAFQFSHHVYYQDGHYQHHSEYVNVIQGMFPNYEFVRELKKVLSQDEGSVFRYANHENSYLNMIYEQLEKESTRTVPDKDALMAFIQTITHSKKDAPIAWRGKRDMIDMLDLVKRFYFDPWCKGSNSIKKILPSILNQSTYLKQKYQYPIYGTKAIPSKNFKDKAWVVFDEHGRVKDPYKLLPHMFQDLSEAELEKLELLNDTEELANGGAALTAYARMQFEQMSTIEREEITRALLKYCELDTLAMVMLYEGWKDLLGFPLKS